MGETPGDLAVNAATVSANRVARKSSVSPRTRAAQSGQVARFNASRPPRAAGKTGSAVRDAALNAVRHIDAGALACHRVAFLRQRRCTVNATHATAAERCRRESPTSGNRAALTAARRARTAGSARCRGAKRDSSSRAAPRRCSIWQLGVARAHSASEAGFRDFRGRLQRLPDTVRHPHLAMTRRAARRHRVRAQRRGILATRSRDGR